MAVWSRRWFIVVPLVLIILGHWSLLLHGILLKAAWVPGEGCVITETNNKVLAVTFIYSMVFDFIVLILTGYKLLYPAVGPSTLVELIFNDGLLYFVIAFLANLLATIFMILDLNPVMSIIANVPAAIAATIVACRAVRRLNNFAPPSASLFPATTTQASTIAFRSFFRPKAASGVAKDGVHVHMETIGSPIDRGSFVEYDATGKLVIDDSFDPEAQAISQDFKRSPY